ncbi:uncharacterized protein LOC135367578 [Ornithodoros turicata]|uniref:uncharacterized protein LOC135367578 n=1 Tax=Ornithodoros turicata TaxID=34597 RepID=UPI003138AD9A
MDLHELIAVGKELGLQGAALKEWVEKEQRERRAQERELLKEQALAREQEQVRENEAAKARAEEAKQLAEEERRTIEMKIRLQELQNQGSGATTTNAAREVGNTLPVTPHRWLAPFDERRDDLDAYLLRFERLATGQRWPKEQWATALSVCLNGDALGVFARLTPEDSAEYDKVKAALLQRFRLTAEGFREKFRSGKPVDGETGTQFAARLSNLFDRWIDLSETKKDYASLRDLLLTEQFVKGCQPKLAMFLRERKTESLADLATLADRFLEAQCQSHLGQRKCESDGSDEEPAQAAVTRHAYEGKETRTRGLCFLCNRLGHKAAYCRSRQRNGICYSCGKEGHRARNCPEEMPAVSQSSCVIVRRVEDKSCTEMDVKDGHVGLKNGAMVPVVNACVTPKTAFQIEGMPAATGKMGKREITVLRDTGSDTVIVKRGLVRQEDMTGRHSPVRLVDGTVRKLPEARIFVKTPFYSGPLTAKCMEAPLYDVIIGNVPNARGPTNPDPNWEEADSGEGTVAETRKQMYGRCPTQAANGRSERGGRPRRWYERAPPRIRMERRRLQCQCSVSSGRFRRT